MHEWIDSMKPIDLISSSMPRQKTQDKQFQQNFLFQKKKKKISQNSRREQQPMASSIAKRYAQVNSLQPKEYWDYDALQIQWK
jgi:hypothetical protein